MVGPHVIDNPVGASMTFVAGGDQPAAISQARPAGTPTGSGSR